MDGHEGLTVLMLFSVHSRGPRCVGYMQRLDRLPQPDKTQTKTPLKPAERWYLARTNDALITEGSLTKRQFYGQTDKQLCFFPWSLYLLMTAGLFVTNVYSPVWFVWLLTGKARRSIRYCRWITNDYEFRKSASLIVWLLTVKTGSLSHWLFDCWLWK